MIDHRNEHQPGHIITMEDPIELSIPQEERRDPAGSGVRHDSFLNALKNMLRQAPDVILIGEVRDTETMDDAIVFAKTGHLALGTLHANNANQALERILNFFPIERHLQIYMQLSSTLRPSYPRGSYLPRWEKGRGHRDTPRHPEDKGPHTERGDRPAEGDHGRSAIRKACRRSISTSTTFTWRATSEYDNALAHADSPNDLRLRIKVAGAKKVRLSEKPLRLRTDEH